MNFSGAQNSESKKRLNSDYVKQRLGTFPIRSEYKNAENRVKCQEGSKGEEHQSVSAHVNCLATQSNAIET